MAGSRVNPHVPRLRCGQAAESALSTRKSPAGQNSSKNVTRLLGARVGCRLDAIAYNKMKKKCAESRFEELCRGQQASCNAEPASWTCKPLKRNFEEISTKTKTFRKKFQNNFQSSNPKYENILGSGSGIREGEPKLLRFDDFISFKSFERVPMFFTFVSSEIAKSTSSCSTDAFSGEK